MNPHQRQFKKGVTLLFRQLRIDGVSRFKQFLIFMDAHGCLIPVGRLGEGVVVHVFDFPHVGKLGKIVEQLRCPRADAAGKIAADPVRHIGVHILTERLFPLSGKGSEAGRALLSCFPGQTQEKFDLLLQRLHGARVDHPELPDALLPGFSQLIGGMSQRDGAEEHIGHARRRPVGIVVVKSVPAAALFLLFRRITADIAVVVVGPYQRHVLRHLKPRVVQLQYLLVGDEGHHGIVPQGVLQDFPLIPDDRFQQLHLGGLPFFLRKLHDGLRLKARIVDSSHTQGIADLKIPVLLHALPPVFLQNLPVPSGDGIIVDRVGIPFFRDPGLPLPIVGAHQHVAVGGSHHNAHPIRQFSVFSLHIEGIDVHGRPDIIGLQTQQQLEYLFIGFHPDGILAHMLFHPPVQLFLIVDENTPVLHGGPVRLFKILRKDKFLLLLHRHVRPEIPGRDAQHAAQLIDAVHGSPPVRSRDDEAAVLHIHQTAFFPQLSVFRIQSAGEKPVRSHQRVKIRGNAQRSRLDLRAPAAVLSILLLPSTKYLFQVRPQVAGRDFHRVRFLSAHMDLTVHSPFQIKIHLQSLLYFFCLTGISWFWFHHTQASESFP